MTIFIEPNDELLQAVVALAQTAGEAIMRVYATEFSVEHKDDRSPLTLADREAHRLILAGLERLTPQVPVLSEESPAAQHEFEQRRQWPEFWLVDPLDGTREFVKRNGEFTVNIALIQAHRPVLGVVSAPALGLTYYAAPGRGARRIVGGGTAEPICTQRPSRRPPVVIGSRSHRSEALDALLRGLGPHEFLPAGSALKFCRVAEGAADFYPRLGPTSEWDTAAGQAILENAGGAVVNSAGLPLRYNQRETLLNPDFFACGDPQFAWKRPV